MHEGQVVEFDPPSVLLNDKDSFFTKLWNEYKEEQSLECEGEDFLRSGL